MYNVELHAGPQIDVAYRGHAFSYSVNNTLPNPLEAFYASLAGCAGVYAKKACGKLGISDEGIAINVRPVVNAGNLMMPEKVVTSVKFPAHIDADARAAIIDSISHCAVKEVVKFGADIQFPVSEAE